MRVNEKIVSTTKNVSEELIVHINREDDLICVSDLLAEPFKRPYTLSLSEVLQRIKNKEAKLESLSIPSEVMDEDGDFETKHKEKRDAAYAAIESLVSNPMMLHRYFYGDAAGILANLVATSGRSKKFVQKMINRFFAGGAFKNTLLPTYYNCGKNFSLPPKPIYLDDKTVCLKSKPGINSSKTDPHRHLTLLDVANIRQFSKTIKIKHKVVFKRLYLDFTIKYMSIKVAARRNVLSGDSAFTNMPLPPRMRISPLSFKYQLKKEVEGIEFTRRRVGQITYDRDFKEKIGLATLGVTRPYARYEIDSTVADIYIRYEYSKDKLLSIGRPIVYLVIDVWSSMIVGFHVAFHGPDWQSASQALYNAFSDKVNFCAGFGIEITEDDWPCHHVCESIVFDRGTENSQGNIGSLLKARFGVESGLFNALYRGEAKGTVEKAFHTVQNHAIPDEAGKVVKAPKREDQHASNDALLTYRDFVKIIIRTILHVNSTKARIESHSSTMLSEEVGITPLDLWNYGLSELTIPITESCDLQKRLYLLPEGTASTTDKGVKFKGLYYSSNEVLDMKILDKAKQEGREKFSVRYFSGNTNNIWLYLKNEKRFLKLELLDRSERYRNKIWDQLLANMEMMKDVYEENDEVTFVSEYALKIHNQDVVKKAKQDTRKLKKSTNKGIQTGIKERREQQGKIEKASAAKAYVKESEVSSSEIRSEMQVVMPTNSLTVQPIQRRKSHA